VPQYGEFIFLKENAALNTTWETAEYTGLTGTVPVKLKYSFTVTAVNITRVVNGVTYNNVYEITWKSMENLNNAGYIDEVLYKSYYARGIGLIEYQQDYVSNPGVEDLEKLRSYQVY
jgi:hypothetical protein